MARMPPSRRPEKFKPKSAAIIEPNKEEDGPPLPQFQFNGERRGSAASISSRIVEKSQYDRRPSHVTQYEEDDIEELEVNLSDPSSNPLEEANNLERVLTRATTRTTHRHAHVEAEKPDEEEIKTFGKRKAKKIAAGKLAVEDGKEYDMSLVKALFLTTWKQWVYNVILGFCGSEFAHSRGQGDILMKCRRFAIHGPPRHSENHCTDSRCQYLPQCHQERYHHHRSRPT